MTRRRAGPTGFIDVSSALGPSTRVYPGDPKVRFALAADPRRGDPARVTRLTLSAHAGTHVDAPNHVPGGRGGVERLSLEALIGPAFVMHLPRRAGGRLTAADLERLPRGAPPRILFRGAPVLLPEAASALLRRGVTLVGTDGLSIDRAGDPGLPCHRLLLRAGVVILEGLDLSRAAEGRWNLIALPLLIPGADGAPARAVLSRARG